MKITTVLSGIGAAAALAVGVTAMTGGMALAQTELKLAHAAPDSDLQQVLSIYFKENVEERTNGEVTVSVFPGSQLGNDAQMIDSARAGVIDIVMSGLNNFTGLVPEGGVIELPFMFASSQAAYDVLDGEVGARIGAELENHGLTVLGYPDNGFRQMTNNRGPISEPDDVAGLRMRVNNSHALSDMFELLGATPEQLPVAELYTALETGVVDAQDHPLGIVVSFKYYEVQKYLSLTNHAYATLVLAMNNDALSGLSDEQQQIVRDVAQEAVDMQREKNLDEQKEMIESLKADGMEVNDDIDTPAFQEKIRPVWDNFIEANGDELVNMIVATTGGEAAE